MQSKIEQSIDDLEEYIGNCKFKGFSSNVLLVNKDEIEELIHNLRKNTPEEIRRVQQVLSQRESILAEAREKAQQLLADATAQTTQLISEHQIMQRAYEQADEVVRSANMQAQQILDTAVLQANDMVEGATAYTDSLLEHVQAIINNTLATAGNEYEALIRDLSEYASLIASNRAELVPAEESYTEEIGGEDDGDSVSGIIGGASYRSSVKPDLDIM